jgi:hypothetical protein
MKRRTAGSWRPAPDNGRSRRGFTIKLLVRDITVALPFHHEVLSAFVVVEGHSAQSQDLSGGPLHVLCSDRYADLGEGATYQDTWLYVRPLT